MSTAAALSRLDNNPSGQQGDWLEAVTEPFYAQNLLLSCLRLISLQSSREVVNSSETPSRQLREGPQEEARAAQGYRHLLSS